MSDAGENDEEAPKLALMRRNPWMLGLAVTPLERAANDDDEAVLAEALAEVEAEAAAQQNKTKQ